MPIYISRSGHIVEQLNDGYEDNNELISLRPSFTIRWGISILSVLILLLVIATNFISYPETIVCNASVHLSETVQPITVQGNGRLAALLTKQGQHVKTGDILGYLQTTANAFKVLAVRRELD